MELVLRFLGLQLSISLGRPDDTEDEYESYRLTSDLAFGFSPDPIFPELEWDEEE